VAVRLLLDGLSIADIARSVFLDEFLGRLGSVLAVLLSALDLLLVVVDDGPERLDGVVE